ncbi:hypothetical protein NP493_185g03007 [Ridgeia piscesae]|uniref:Uncharacterized protein n=1 Tax=Ridgeia piscesae TaxID=27915 RepID=A0AAD9P2S4_RIDPI|nr:hypothetical protein NP493_185g03007 [Ridgeia piscesae]
MMLREKHRQVSSDDYGRDEDAADKLLTKHKVVEGEVNACKGIVQALGKDSDKMKGSEDAKDIANRQANLERQLRELEKGCVNRRNMLEESKKYHAYTRDCNELDEWIAEQMQVASSEDYGQDFEHLQVIQKKFSEFQLGIEAGSDLFSRCDQRATQLVEDGSPYSTVIQERQDKLRTSWDELLQQVDARDQKLQGAGEIHRFNRDVEDALSRIQEKYAAIPEDLGRDTKAVQGYLKKHEGFENELVALEAQLQVLVDDSARLQEAYPGGNAEQIAQQQAVVIENWTILQEKAAQRKDNLLAALDLYRFLTLARDLVTWSDEMQKEMTAEQPVRDVTSVDLLRKSHQQLKAEIEAREDSFATAVDTGRKMIDASHFAKNECHCFGCSAVTWSHGRLSMQKEMIAEAVCLSSNQQDVTLMKTDEGRD